MNTVQPVTFSERPAFYREKQSDMYSPLLYVACNTLVEIPYVLVASLLFTLPFFFIVGLEDEGDAAAKLLWYWTFVALLLGVMVFAGQFFSVLLPSEGAAGGGHGAVCAVLCCDVLWDVI
jgi:ABC-type multidrug transport system permease subunit